MVLLVTRVYTRLPVFALPSLSLVRRKNIFTTRYGVGLYIKRAHRFLFFVAWLQFFFVPRHAFALNPKSEFEKGRAAYIAKNFQEAERRFFSLLKSDSSGLLPNVDSILTVQTRMYLGATLWQQKKRGEAISQFETLLLADPHYEPDPLSFSEEIIETFIDTRAHMRDKLNAAAVESAKKEAEKKAQEEAKKKLQEERISLLQKLASEERVVIKHSRLVAALPFGVGQFQNDQLALGWFFLGTQFAALIGSAVTIPLFVNSRQRALEEYASGDLYKLADKYNARASQIRLLNLSFVGAFFLSYGISVLEAELNFVPEIINVRKRKPNTFSTIFPPSLPYLRPHFREENWTSPNGLEFGIIGRF